MAPAAGNEGAVDDDGLALDVAAKKIWFGADANPYRFGGETSGTRALGARHGEGSDEIDLVTIGCRVTGVPALGASLSPERMERTRPLIPSARIHRSCTSCRPCRHRCQENAPTTAC